MDSLHKIYLTVCYECLIIKLHMKLSKQISKTVLLAIIILFAACTQNDQLDILREQLTDQQKQIDILKETASTHAKAIATLLEQPNPVATDPNSSSDPQKLTIDQTNQLIDAINECVQTVHEAAPNNNFFQQFDAYYNSTTGRVANNVIFVGGRPALYTFQKCMSNKSWPLS